MNWKLRERFKNLIQFCGFVTDDEIMHGWRWGRHHIPPCRR